MYRYIRFFGCLTLASIAGDLFLPMSHYNYAQVVPNSEKNLEFIKKCEQYYLKGQKFDLKSCEKLLAYSVSTKNRVYQAKAFLALGLALSNSGEIDKGMKLMEKTLNIAQDIKDPLLKAYALFGIGSSYLGLGDRQKSIDYTSKAAKLFKELKNQEFEVRSLQLIAVIYTWLLKDREQGLKYYQESIIVCNKWLQESKEKKDIVGQFDALFMLGSTYPSLNEKQKALEYLIQASKLIKSIENPKKEYLLLLGLSAQYTLLDKTKAEQYYKESEELLKRNSDVIGSGEIYGSAILSIVQDFILKNPE